MNQPSYTELEPNFAGPVTTLKPQFFGSSVTFFASSSFLYTLLFSAIVVSAGGMIIYGAILRLVPSASSEAKSREIFWRVLKGVVGTFSFALIFLTFNRDLLRGDIDFGILRAGVGSGGITTSQDNPDRPVAPPSPGSRTTAPPEEWWKAINESPEVRKRLGARGITFNNNTCRNPAETACTTVGGLPEDTLAMLEQLKDYCPGELMVTGGTEAGHSAHGPGKRAVDLSRKSAAFNACVEGFEPTRNPGFCHATYKKFGYTFCNEVSSQPHWHVDIR